MIGLNGEFFRPQQAQEYCPIHPTVKLGSCGFWLGREHGWAEEVIREVALDKTIDKVNAFLKFKGLEKEFLEFKLPIPLVPPQ